MKNFAELWRDINMRPGVITVQNKEELEHVFNLMQGCESYLEVGTAEGNSLFVLSHALKEGAPITYIDFGEKHTTEARDEVLNRISNPVHAIHGDSNDFTTYHQVQDKKFDVVLIDAGHKNYNVMIDALFYGALATKYIVFHDVQLPEVNQAFLWYCKQFSEKKSYRVVNSEHFGYGVLVV